LAPALPDEGVLVMDKGSGVDAGGLEMWDVAGDSGKAAYAVHSSPVKRALDLALTLPLVVFVSPLLMLIYALLKILDPGPALFTQVRVGRDGAYFVVYKFRTMRVDAEQRLKHLLKTNPHAAAEWAKYQKLRNDPRVTMLGKFLRKSSLDELPQLLNILRGEMSVIGPRPVTASEMQRYGAAIPFYTAARPGVLGLWQVKGRNRLTYPERISLDIEYVQTWSIWQDFRILFMAIPVVLLARGAY
jgi:undecaprenyl-phosphate galactose phosphotransferase